MRISSTAARRLALPSLACLALMTPASAPARAVDAAKSVAPLRSISAPPEQVLAGSAFTVTARVLNSARRSTRPRAVVRLRKYKYASGGRVLFARKLGRVGAGDARRFRIGVELPESVADGRYWLSVCVRTRADSGCKLSSRRLTVSHATPSPGGQPPAQQPEAAAPPPLYDVMAFTEAVGESHGSASDGIDALRDIGRRERFRVTVESSSSGAFTEANLKRYRAVVFLNTAGDVLDDAEQTAFESYFKDGGGFLGIHSAIVTEPDWQFLTDLLGTRATGPAAALDDATIKVADRVHDASKSLPEYWGHSDEYYNFTSNVRGFSHVLATVDETTYAGGTMGFDHPVAWCKDYQGGRSFYTAVGHTRQAFRSDTLRRHLAGAVAWTAGRSDPVYSDCGATVLANFQQVKITAPPNLNEPIGFDQLPDGRIIQTTRDGRVRLHDPETGSVDVIASLPVYAHSEDGLYGPAVDNNFAGNRWVYLYYSPLEMEGTALNGKPYPATTPPGNAPTVAANPAVFDDWLGYFQLSRFKFVEAAGSEPAHLDLESEQKIMKVEVDRGACCHVAGDIDFDKHNNLWLVTGDDTPAGSIGTNQFPPFNDMKTNETQTVAIANATGGTFTLTFDGQTTAPIAFPFTNATNADIEAKLEALPNIENVLVSGNQGTNRQVAFGGQYSREDVPLMTGDETGLTPDAATLEVTTTQEADWFVAPHNDARRSSTNVNDLRGKVLRIKVNGDGSYSIPHGNLFPEGIAKTRPEIYAMGFRNPFRIQVDSDGVAYVTDYSPDSRGPGQLRAAAGTGRVEIVRRPSNYGWPMCYGPQLPMYEFDFNMQETFGEPFDCDDRHQGPANTSRWNTGLRHGPPIAQPDIWYSYNDNATPPLGTPCLAYYDGSGGTCPQLFPELGTGGVGPHGADKYEYDPVNPSKTKFPPYYDDAVILGEFTRDWLREVRLDSRGGIQKINNTLNCGAFGSTVNPFECDNPMDMQFGDDGNLYLLTYGDGFFVANPDAGLYRFEYVAGDQDPKAVLSATPTNGVAPLQVQFSSEGSTDPDLAQGDSIRFQWDFGVPGTDTDVSLDPNPTFTYTANGVYTARLTVTDAAGNANTKTIPITVGNTAPTVTISTPVDGDFFEWGDSIPYSVTVTDPQDASIDCNRVQVTFVLVHDQHGHGEATQTGCSGTLPTSPDNASHGGYLAGGINVSYTDTGGAGGTPPLTTNAQHVVQLRRQHVEYVQAAQGLQFSAVQAPETDPLGAGQAANQIDNGDWLLLNNRYSFDNMDKQVTLRFANNQAAGTLRGMLDVRLDAVDGPVIASCELRATGANGVYTSQTCPFTGTVTGSHKVYLTFRQAPGGPATGFGLLNWVEFSGPGV